jgi:hypothetical protein
MLSPSVLPKSDHFKWLLQYEKSTKLMKVIYREVCLDLQHPASPPEPESLSFLPDPCPLFRNTSLSPGP